MIESYSDIIIYDKDIYMHVCIYIHTHTHTHTYMKALGVEIRKPIIRRTQMMTRLAGMLLR